MSDDNAQPFVFGRIEVTPDDIVEALKDQNVFRIAKRCGWDICRLIRMKRGKATNRDIDGIRFLLGRINNGLLLR